MTDRELINRLLFLAQTAVDQALDLNYDDPEDYFIYRELRELKAAALAQPEPQGATDERITSIAKAVQECARAWSPNIRLLGNVSADDIDDLCNFVLARWGRPAIEPVPGVEGGND